MVKADGTSGDVNGRDAANATILTIDQAEKIDTVDTAFAIASIAYVAAAPELSFTFNPLIPSPDVSSAWIFTPILLFKRG